MDDHSPESYRLLFSLLGLGLLLLVLVFILASVLVLPIGVVLALIAVWAAGSFWSLTVRRRMPWLPLAVGGCLAALWIVVLTAGSAIFGWSP